MFKWKPAKHAISYNTKETGMNYDSVMTRFDLVN